MSKTYDAIALTSAERFKTQPSDHIFFATMAILAAVVVVTGFASTYAPKVVGSGAAVPAIIHLHAAVFASWLALFIAQTTLASRGRLDLHRRLGVYGLFLAALMLIMGVLTSISSARLDHRGIPGVEFPDAAGFLLLNLSAVFAFFILAASGWFLRGNPQAHKRLMLLATVGGLMPPGIARLPIVSSHPPLIGMLAMAFLLTGPVYDLVTRRRIHPAYLCGLVPVFLTLPPVVGALSAGAVWHGIAAWLIG